ncbi:MAG: hypothetical protein WHT06_10330 [Desulfobacterales bacterium]
MARNLAAVMLVSFFVAAGSAFADENKLNAKFALWHEYNSNIYFSPKDEKDDFITRTKAGLEWLNRSERSELFLSGFLTPYFYWKESDLSALDQDYQGRFSWRASERLTFGADAELHFDYEPDRVLTSSGIIFNNDRRIRQRYGANGSWNATELDLWRSTYVYAREDWRATLGNDAEDWEHHGVGVGYTRELGARRGMSQGLVDFGFGRYDYETSDSRYLFATVGARHRLSELVTVSGNAGPLYLDSEYKVREATGSREKDDAKLGFLGRLALEYASERTDLNLSAYRDMNPSGGGSGVLRRTALIFDGGYRIREKLRAGLYAAGFLNKSENQEFTGGRTDRLTSFITPNLRWELVPDLLLEIGYSFVYGEDRAAEEESHRHYIYAELTYDLGLLK